MLVVEDDEITLGFLADNLAADGFRVASATAPGEAIRALDVRQPDLVVLDLMLEGGSGLDVLDRVRSAGPGASRVDPELPILVLSARGSEVAIVRGDQHAVGGREGEHLGGPGVGLRLRLVGARDFRAEDRVPREAHGVRERPRLRR